jgi:nicotinate-nucleotide adenylyltransferase
MTNLNQTENSARRIGLFGGTFNPIHRGHVQVAKDVLNQFELDHIYFIPCALPPHKAHSGLVSAKDRVEMARLALADQNTITVSSIETDRGGSSYTIDTLKAFKSSYSLATELYFMVGVDAFFEIHTWKSHRQLFDLSAFIVMTRPLPDQKPVELVPLVFDYARHHISEGYTLASNGKELIHADKKTIHPVTVTPIAIASSQIRDMVRHGDPIQPWVNPVVSDYIDNKGLYR